MLRVRRAVCLGLALGLLPLLGGCIHALQPNQLWKLNRYQAPSDPFMSVAPEKVSAPFEQTESEQP